jgi:hypothetical protein
MNQRGAEKSSKYVYIDGNGDVNMNQPGWLISRETFPRIREDFLMAAYNEVIEGNQESHDRKRVTLGQSVVILKGHTVCTTQHEAWEPSQPHAVPWQEYFEKYHLYKLYI